MQLENDQCLQEAMFGQEGPILKHRRWIHTYIYLKALGVTEIVLFEIGFETADI